MKAKKPTYQQRKLIERENLDTYKWYVQKDSPQEMQIKNVETEEIRIIQKS